MFNVGDELIGISGNSYFVTGEGKQVVVLSVQEIEKDPIFLQKYKHSSDGLIVALVEDSKNQHFQSIREATIVYLEQASSARGFTRGKDLPELYVVNSKYFKLHKRIKQANTFTALGPRLIKEG